MYVGTFFLRKRCVQICEPHCNIWSEYLSPGRCQPAMIRVARFFLTHNTKTGQNYTYQMSTKLLNGHKLYQMAVTYSKWPLNIYQHSKYFFVDIYADSMLTRDNKRQPEVAFCLCRVLHPYNKCLGGLSRHPIPATDTVAETRMFATIFWGPLNVPKFGFFGTKKQTIWQPWRWCEPLQRLPPGV
jgi:hypothetical protein